MSTTASVLAPRTRRLLEAPVLPTLLGLAGPNIGEAIARVTFITADALFVSWLGNDALAGVSVVFPLLLVLQMVTAGGFGTGVAASIGRALGAGDVERARTLAGTALALTLIGAALTSVVLVAAGPTLYAAMGLDGTALALATSYGALAFGGSVLIWLMNILANVSRGAGNMLVPASAIAIGEAFHLTLSPALILGWGPLPQLGIAGAAIAVLAAYGVGAAVLLTHLLSRHALVQLQWRHVRVRRDEGAAILGIGGFAALAMVQFQATAFFVTGLVGQLGASAIAAYGAATRLELLQAPITFAFGSAVITLIATALGAGDTARARRITSTSMVVTASIGVVFMLVGLAGRGWMAFFTGDAQIRDLGALYLLTQAPVYPLYGAGLAAYFACQGAGEVKWPTVMVTLRLAIAVLGGWAALALTGAALPLFLMSSVGLAALGLGLIVIARARFSGI